MSAISVIWTVASQLTPAILHGSMLDAQQMYGRDGRFAWNDDRIALGVNQSRLLPEDVFDQQPVWNTDRSVCMVADVRLDNRADLIRELHLIRPESLPDSSLLFSAWLRWGASCLDHILGAFAFAVWTPGQNELFAARDHAGDRPLFYHRENGVFALASMPKGLLALPGVATGFSERQVADWLAYVRPDRHKSLFKGLSRLPPGHLLRVTPDRIECQQYWHPSGARPTRYKKDDDYAQAMLEIFDRATAARLRSAKQIGSQLSAGLDSAAVTSSAAHLLSARNLCLTAFTSVPRRDYDGRRLAWQIVDEGPGATEVATMYPNIDHVLVDSQGHELVATLKTWIEALDEPAVNVLSLLWYVAMIEQAKQRDIGVMLEGTTGNATLSWESWSLLRLFFRQGRWLELATTAASLRRHGDISIKAAISSALGGLLPGWLDRLLTPGLELMDLQFSMVNPKFAQSHDLAARVTRENLVDTPNLKMERALFFEGLDPGPTHAALQALCGIDFRDPTADKRVFEFCYSIPPEQFVAEGHARSLVRRAMKHRLPESTLLRYRRGRQSADWYLPMTESLPLLADELSLQAQSPAAQRALDLPRMQELLDTWPEDGFETKRVDFLWHIALSRGLSMGHFLRSRETPLSEQLADSPPSPLSAGPPTEGGAPANADPGSGPSTSAPPLS